MNSKKFISELEMPNIHLCTKQELVEYYENLKKEYFEFIKQCKIECIKEHLDGNVSEAYKVISTNQYIKLVVKNFDKKYSNFVKRTDRALINDLLFMKKLNSEKIVEEEKEI